jgi:hypothetical protein
VIEVRPGQTPAELVPGQPDEVERLAARLSRFAAGAGDASVRLRGLDSAHWSGSAAELFRSAVGPMPQQLAQAGNAFTLAARALAGYARVLREAQATAGRAIRLVEQSTPDSAGTDRQTAQQQLERARADVTAASRAAAARLSELAADAPTDVAQVAAAGPPALRSGGVSVRAVAEHELADPDGFVAPTQDLPESVRFGADHAVPFADAAAGGPAGGAGGWESWAQQGSGRALGVVGISVLAGLGIGATGLIGRRRRDRTALAVAGIDEADLRRRQGRLGGPVHAGHLVRARAAGPRSADTWRTRVASAPRPGATVHVWAASEANPLRYARRAEPVPMGTPGPDVTGAVLRTGPPPDEGRRDSGATR